MDGTSTRAKPHVVILSSPGMGHLIPALELGKRLLTFHNLDVTIFDAVASHRSAAEAQVIKESAATISSSTTPPKSCRVIELPPVDISGLVDPGALLVTRIRVLMREIRPALRSALSALEFRPAALIVDLFGTESFVVADELKLPKYVFVTCNAWFLSLTIYTPILDKVVKGEYVDQEKPLEIPGCRPVRPEDVVDPMLDRTNQQYFEYVGMGVEIPASDGILVNTWEDLEPDALAALRDENLLGHVVKEPVYPVGPLSRLAGGKSSTTDDDHDRDQLVSWLDMQPKESVIYVSFGSGGTLSLEQMTEVAWGLELSRQRFVWVVRPPTKKERDAAYFTPASGGGDDIASYLPERFLDRTRNMGLVVPQWAPQVDILAHPSVGGFLTHGGWNSALESFTNGVPMIAWPLYAEQRMNTTMLSEGLGVAVRSRILPSKAVVGRGEIEAMIRMIMVEEEGIKIRNRVKELKLSAEMALGLGGSSYNALALLAKEIETTWSFSIGPMGRTK